MADDPLIERGSGWPGDPMNPNLNSSDVGSVSQWLGGARRGDQEAIRSLWGRYFPRLKRLAARRLARGMETARDAEDVALDAFAALCRLFGTLPGLHNRTHLWRLLACFTVRRAVDLARQETRRCLLRIAAEDSLNSLVGREPPPEFSAAVADLLECLPSDELRQLATAKMEGFTNEEIARRLGRSLSTVERKLQVIRLLWQDVR